MRFGKSHNVPAEAPREIARNIQLGRDPLHASFISSLKTSAPLSIGSVCKHDEGIRIPAFKRYASSAHQGSRPLRRDGIKFEFGLRTRHAARRLALECRKLLTAKTRGEPEGPKIHIVSRRALGVVCWYRTMSS